MLNSILVGADPISTTKQTDFSYKISDMDNNTLYECPKVYRSIKYAEIAALIYCFDNYKTSKTIITII